jgi:hypothetical protein
VSISLPSVLCMLHFDIRNFVTLNNPSVSFS